ncbi:MAG: 16S rRNA (cytosine(1402)-N(4))-methyltransferase RsmH [Deltaproteobacteria bacterium]|jgi:16S rRNA (cytosine1402-N4)-methyltransferase|nr:16S rRNA (cytosine(1402)-N(4))-methyltransferase RsmH [Deltaproteobacteria bacterium]
MVKDKKGTEPIEPKVSHRGKPLKSVWLDVPPDLKYPFYEPDEWSKAFGHIPVMPNETTVALDVKPRGFYVDLTMGGGGHSRMILSQLGPKGRLLALDRDPEAVRWASIWAHGDRRLILKRANFSRLDEILEELNLGLPDGLLADLGLSSRQILGPGRGFSWLRDEPLDMRMDPESGLTAYDIVNEWPEDKLIELIRYKAEERSSVRLTKTIMNHRARKPLETTGELADLVGKVLWRTGHHARSNLATKVFMGLRLVVNQEMEALDALLKKAHGCLKPGGRMVVISFHSLEDRQVKRTFGSLAGKKYWEALYKKPVQPTRTEVAENRKARSAKLRAARRLEPAKKS